MLIRRRAGSNPAPTAICRGQGLMESRLPWEQESPSSTLGTPTLKTGTRCCWRHAGPANPTDGFETHSLHHIAAVAEWSRREFPKLADAGSSPAGSLVRARVAQRKSDTRGEGLMRVQVSSRAPILRQKAEGGRQKAEGRRQKAEGRRQKAEGRRFAIFHLSFVICHLSFSNSRRLAYPLCQKNEK